MKRVWRLLTSARLAAWLIGLVALATLVGVIVPQRDVFGSAAAQGSAAARFAGTLGLDRVFTSWPFLVLVALLGIDVVACTIDRVVRRARRVPRVPAAIPADARVVETPLPPGDAVAASAEALRTWRVTRDAERDALRGETGGAGFAGSILAHAGLVVLIAGGIASALTTFTGTMLLTEGQTLPDSAESYLTVEQQPRLGSPFGDFTVRLDSLAFAYDGGTVTDAVARMTVTQGAGVTPVEARVNYPLAVQGKSFLLLNAGYAAGLTVADASGTALVSSFVNLGTPVAEGYADELDVDGTRLGLLAVPDARVPLGTAAARRLEPTDPGLWVTAPGGERVLLRPGETRHVGSLRVTFGELRRWNRFLVRADRGRWIVYVAFAMLLAGTALRLLYPDRYLAVVADGGEGATRVALWGTSRLGRPGLQRALAALEARLTR